MYRAILVPVDGSPLAEQALPQALLIAHLAGARVILLQVIPPGGDDAESASEEVEALRGGEAYLKELAARTANGLDVESVVLVGEPALTIMKEVKRRSVDLVVMSTHGRSGLGRWIYGSVADAVMRHAPVPVVLVPATRRASPQSNHPPRILVPLDGSNLAEEVLGPAEDIAGAMGADLVLTRVVEPRPATYTDMDYLAIDPTAELAAARSYLEKIAARLSPKGRSVILQEDFGFAVTTIQELAQKQDVAMIAMATHGHGGITRLLLGSVGTGVVQHSNVPVFLVRPAAREPDRTETTNVATEQPEPPASLAKPEETIVAAAEGDPQAAVALLRAMAHPDVGSYLRFQARLRQATNPRLWEHLIEYLGTQQWAGHSIGVPFASEQDYRELYRRVQDTFLSDPGALAEGPKLQALRTATRRPETPIRVVALDFIGRRGDLAAIDDVVAALRSEPLAVKEVAARALGHLGGATAIAALVDALHAQHDVLARTITNSLVRQGAQAVPVLIAALDDQDAFVRWHAAKALADIGDRRAIDPLLHSLEDVDTTVRWEAARGLAHQGKPAIVALLRALETRPLSPWLAQGTERILHDAPLRNETFRLQSLADSLYHSTASLEVPLRAAEVLREIETVK